MRFGYEGPAAKFKSASVFEASSVKLSAYILQRLLQRQLSICSRLAKQLSVNESRYLSAGLIAG
jgi:hypothetical protein